MNIPLKKTVAALGGAMLAGAVGTVAAHDIDEAGTPVCTEANYMMADAMNAPFASANGPGRVIEMNIVTGTPGITVGNPFNGGNAGTDICPDDTTCPAAWKPTGVLSGGQNGHAFITSAGQVALTEFHRDGTPIRTTSYKSLLGNPTTGGPFNAGFASVPRPLGTQLMPNGNLIQAICDANFFNAFNSDSMGPGESGITFNAFPGPPVPSTNSSYLYFPPVYSTDERASNSRLLVIDQETMEVIDEYSRPEEGKPGHDLWGCFAGIMFSDAGMYVSTFHGAAVLEIDWKKGNVGGVGKERNGKGNKGNGNGNPATFEINDPANQAVVTGVIDFRLGKDADDPSRRDSLRAISFDESANIYATDRARSRDCLRGEAPGAVVPDPSAPPCNPSVFRQRVNIASWGGEEIEDNDDEIIIPGGFDSYNDSALRRSIGLDPGVNVIAGIRTNRMSRKACDYVQANHATYATTDPFGIPNDNLNGYAPYEDLCDVETLLIASSAFNPGEILAGCVDGHPANACFKPGGGVGEYIIHPNFTDGGPAYGVAGCSGDPTDPAGNQGCAQPIATFKYTNPGDATETEVKVDPRMLMVIHEAFGQ